MTASQFCKSVRRDRWLSTRHGRERPHFRPSSQIIRQFVELGLTRHLFVSPFTVEELVASARFKSASSPAALKSP
jgi:hypothetical protein